MAAAGLRPWVQERTPSSRAFLNRSIPPPPVRRTASPETRARGSPMGSILLINAAGRETRVARVENGHIAEFYLERKKDKGVVGNIYKGRVVRVLPGMQAAFVDIGLDKAAFLYVSDVVYDPDFARAQFELTEGEHEDAPEVPDELDDPGAPVAAAETPSLHDEVEHVDAHADALHEAAHAAAFNEGGAAPVDAADEIDDDELDVLDAGADEPFEETGDT